MLPPLTSTNSIREQIKTSPVSNYVARGEAISSQGGRKSWGKAGHGEAAARPGCSPWRKLGQVPTRAGMSLYQCHGHSSSCCCLLCLHDTHIQLPEERLQLVSVLELWAEFLVQVCIHLLQKLLSILGVFLKLQRRKVPCERGSC